MNVSRVAYLAVLTLLFLVLVTQTAAAEPVSDNKVNMHDVVLVEDESEDVTKIILEYDTSFSVRIGTFLFGSEALEEQVLDSLGVDESEVEFVSLNSESAEILYFGEAESLSPEDAEVVEFEQ